MFPITKPGESWPANGGAFEGGEGELHCWWKCGNGGGDPRAARHGRHHREEGVGGGGGHGARTYQCEEDVAETHCSQHAIPVKL